MTSKSSSSFTYSARNLIDLSKESEEEEQNQWEMAAYAALVSIMQIIDQIQRHPRPPISLHKEQTESLTKVVTFLQDFLEGYNPHVTYTTEEDPLESCIADAAYAAEDVIESYIVDQIHARHNNAPGNISSDEFYQDLQKVIEEMDLIRMKVGEIKEKQGVHIKKAAVKAAAGSFRSTSTAPKVGMIGFEDVLNQMLDKVTRGQADLQIIPIVGMGGIGKTTLAQSIYVDPLVKEYFDVRAWSTISQEYNALEILKQVIDEVDGKDKENRKMLNEYEIGEQLYKYLIGRRYLIVMDDMWSINAWDSVRRWFPNNDNGSRVVVTTRLSNLASQFNESNSLKMEFLDEGSSWNLFSKTVFGEEICPLELEDIGKKIVEGCKGLPLSISVIGGLLSKTGRTQENWELVKENLNANVNLEDNENCLQILYTSYNNLPVYLKPCFLYMGMFPEDENMVSYLVISLWIAEGFVKPFHGKCLEEIGEMYLEELIERNLILVEDGRNRNRVSILIFKIHDLLRDLSLREAQKLKFCHELGKHSSMPDVTQRRIRGGLSEYPTPVLESLESSTLVRSLFGTLPNSLSHSFRLLRVSNCDDTSFDEEKGSEEEHEKILLGQVNLRYFRIDFCERILPSSIYLLWNLQTIILSESDGDYIFEIWKMPQLRLVMFIEGRLDGTYCFPNQSVSGDMHMDHRDGFVVMENMHTLVTVRNLSIREEVINIIPNIKMLFLYYDQSSSPTDKVYDYRLNNLSRLHKLEFLSLEYSKTFHQHTLTHLVTFPYSLKILLLIGTKLYWEDMQRKIGLLPLLQVLKLLNNACIGSEWETFEGQFSSLKSLTIDSCADLKYWKTDNTHFPRLEDLGLGCLDLLSEIPLSIGDIPTLRSMVLYRCNDSMVDSARRIQEEQEALSNEDLQIKIMN